MLQEQKGRFPGADGEVLLHLGAFLATEGRVGEDHVHAVLVLDVGQVLGQGVGMDDVRRLDAVQDHVHDRDHVGEALLFLAVEGAHLQGFKVSRAERGLGGEIVIGFAQEASRAAGTIIDALTDFRLDHLDHGADERAGGVVLAAVTPGVAHALDLLFVQRREFVLFHLGAEAQFIHVVDDVAQGVATADLVLDLAEDFANLVFDGVGAGGALLEAVQVGEELAIDKIHQVITGQRAVVVQLAIRILGGSSAFPAVGFIEDVTVALALQHGLSGLVLFQPIQIFQEQQPGRLLGVIEFGGTAAFFPERVVDVLEGLFKHRWISFILPLVGQFNIAGDNRGRTIQRVISGSDVERGLRPGDPGTVACRVILVGTGYYTRSFFLPACSSRVRK